MEEGKTINVKKNPTTVMGSDRWEHPAHSPKNS